MDVTKGLYSQEEAADLLLQAMAAVLAAASPEMDREACVAVCRGIQAGTVQLRVDASVHAKQGLRAVCSIERDGESIDLLTIEAAVGCFRFAEVHRA